MLSKRYIIRKPDTITHFIVIDPDNETVVSECVDNEEPYTWIYMLEQGKQATTALTYLEYYLEESLYYELTEDEFYKARITLDVQVPRPGRKKAKQ